MKKTGQILLIVFLICILVAGGVFFGMELGNRKEEGLMDASSQMENVSEKNETAAEVDAAAEAWTGAKETYQGKSERDTIDIPGFDSMSIQAGIKEQNVNLYNPEQNTCYFKMSLYLNDGTLLWESKLIQPGKAVYNLTLNQPVDAGEYQDCILKYECFSMDENQTPLNGSEIHFTLISLQ